MPFKITMEYSLTVNYRKLNFIIKFSLKGLRNMLVFYFLNNFLNKSKHAMLAICTYMTLKVI